MRASFQELGRTPVERDMLNSLVRLGTMVSTVPLSIFAEIPSGPVDFAGSRLRIRSNTSASLHSSSGGKAADCSLEGASVSGGHLSLKQV